MKRTRAPGRPAACGSSTRIGYQFGPSPMIMATSLHVAPESPENWMMPCCCGVKVEP